MSMASQLQNKSRPVQIYRFNKLFIFDWDDTLYPTTALRPIMKQKTKSLKSAITIDAETIQSLKEMIQRITALLKHAKEQDAHVVIVTMASYKWVQKILDGSYNKTIASIFAPLLGSLKLNNTEIISARDEYKKRKNKATPTDMKMFAIQRILDEKCVLWDKNMVNVVMSIGDSNTEYDASRCVVEHYMRNTDARWYLCRMKLRRKPSICHLTTGWVKAKEKMEEFVNNKAILSALRRGRHVKSIYVLKEKASTRAR